MTQTCTAFRGSALLATGPLAAVALAVKAAIDGGATETILAFDDATGRVVDFDLRGSEADIAARHTPEPARRGRGRPKLGVVAREVTLLPRHWEWLAAQPGGASVALRKLVEEARRDGKQKARSAQEAAYRFMSAMGGNLPGYEEAIRALFADDRERFERHVAEWPSDVRGYATKLAFGSFVEAAP